MAPGRKPTDPDILSLKGSRAAKGRGGSTFKAGAPVRPTWLPEAAAAEWDAIVPTLGDAGILTPADVNQLARYCCEMAQWKKLAAFVAENGVTFEMTTGKGGSYVQIRPEAVQANKLAISLGKTEAEFGMTSASRSRVKPNKPVSETDAGKFIAGKPKVGNR